ncbi:unnamed protein product [Rangifer tarandus platyrhynchus]|uniref:Uncharacterized protein n=1 Tax=Rangifer tarandus platyrhynchus TaxID=3082113 RepID=A0ABN8Y3S2_RANTA|nr:unnamed protein product [Rangifer tarandus platyrhynchus]
MAATRRELQRDRARFVYVTRFGSHQCGGVLPLGGRRAQGPRHAGLKDGHRQEKPRAAAPAIPGAAELPLCFRFGPSRPAPPRGVERAERAQAGGACRGSGWLGGRGPRAADASTRLSSHLAGGSSHLNGRLLSLSPAATPRPHRPSVGGSGFVVLLCGR